MRERTTTAGTDKKTASAIPLFSVGLFEGMPPLEKWCPMGYLSYVSRKFAQKALSDAETLLELIDRMSEGIEKPRITYRCKPLATGMMFGHGRWHFDGRGEDGEIHRLLTIGGTPTEGRDGAVLSAGTVWEYSGKYEHRARPVEASCVRLLIRVSKTDMLFRDHWSLE